jgi:uncharacterized protein with PQ loop repeat
MEPNSNSRLPGFFPLIKQALEIYKQKWGTLITLFLLPFLAITLCLLLIFAAGIGIKIAGAMAGLSLPFWILFAASAVLFFLLLAPAWAWVQCAAIIAVKERPAVGTRESLRRAKPKILPYLLTVLPLYLAAGAGLMFFVMPGIVIGIWGFAGGYIAATEDKRGAAALAKSREYVRGYFLKIFFLLAVEMLLSFLVNGIAESFGSNPIELLINFAFAPLLFIFNYLIFEKLKQIKGDLPEPTAEQKNLFRIPAGVGLAIAISLVALAINFAPQIKQEYEIRRLQYEAETKQELPPLPI